MSEQELATILHVDDNEANRYIVARILRNAGFEIKEAVTGKAGLQAVEEQQPDLTLRGIPHSQRSGAKRNGVGWVQRERAAMNISPMKLDASPTGEKIHEESPIVLDIMHECVGLY